MNKVGTGLLYFLALGVAGYAAFAYLVLPLGSSVDPSMKESFVTHAYGVYFHIFASIVALVLGPFQFSARLRTRFKNLHRWSGRVYLGIGVLIGGLAGLYIAQYSAMGTTARLGFASLAIVWLFTGFRAFSAIRRGDVSEHRKWMVRNFSLTFAAVTLRLYLPLSMVAGFEFAVAYPVISWLAWIPNLIFAELWIYRKFSKIPVAIEGSGVEIQT